MGADGTLGAARVPLRVGIDGTCWLNRRGYGRFARRLLGALWAQSAGTDIANTLVIDFDPTQLTDVPRDVALLRVDTARPAARAAAADGRRSLRDLWRTSRAISAARFDVVFFPTAYTFVPISGPAKVAVVIHDVIAEAFPEHVFPTRRAAWLWRLKLLAARRQADLVMTVSAASKRGIIERFGISPDRIMVVSEAADPCFRTLPHDAAMQQVLARWGLEGVRFLLYVGGISPHKNLGALVAAFAALRKQPECADYRLVLVGDYAGDVFYSAYDGLRRQIAQHGLEDAVRFTGYVPDEELVYLYNAAEVFVLPSLLEGFGLPVVEAMACGAPVVASARGALPEVLGTAGVLFDPQRPGELHAAVQRVCTDLRLRHHLRQAGPRRAAELSWQRAAADTLSALRHLTAPPSQAIQHTAVETETTE